MAVIQIDNYNNDCVRQPDHVIVAVEKQYITNTSYCVKEDDKCMSIIDNKGNEQFKCMKKDDRIVICNLEDIPILNSFVYYIAYRNMYVYKGESETEQLVHIKMSKKSSYTSNSVL
ncbi:hypothetical protein PIROE2DRAFT_11832 [Piromyces sp. E2]|nr:hypothetical protein PIROE2DRAFT_11832 [Piromyces sp. E2]|eukprot:OUM62011.1 hypothetical protein PIROE2DRAFT_11832 [Piromyces sp. E2]